MVAVDTNVLVRLLVRDDEIQFKSALAIFRDQKVFLPDSVLLETEWVLRFAYEYPPEEVCSGLRRALGLKNVFVEDPTRIAKVIAWHEAGLDFADALHLAGSEHLSSLKTFDRAFVKQSKGLSACKASAP
ncbi:MAG TPA: type II toxin-antitoxin system VapC family toxin [Fibrobacteria bacterium]|nr:type II toxin-antitoxin system VapC family toxin [Fibrobacteria bacterium]